MTPAEDTVQKIGRYDIVRKIATGGMAELFLGKFTGPGGFEKRCALKRILPQFAADQTFQKMFQNEARVTAMFDHPNVVQVFELGQDDAGQYFIAMELVNGVNLRQLMAMARDAHHPIPPELAAFMMTQALDGLSYAHNFRDPDSGEALNLVHRDISPQNILVSYDGAVKLVDFGIVKGSSISGETQAGMLKGKVAYMSPEQASGDPLDARSDLFSLGVCFYELIAGQRPFQGQNEIMTLKAILDDAPIPVTEFAPDVAEGIEHAIHRALGKWPDERYPSARDFLLELQHVLRDCPTPLSRHVVSDYIRSLTEGNTITFDATRLKIPRGLRSNAGFGMSVAGYAPSGSNPGISGSHPGYMPQAPHPSGSHPGYAAQAPGQPSGSHPSYVPQMPGPATSNPGAPSLTSAPTPTPAGTLDYSTPPQPAEPDPRTPLPLDESIGGTSEMLRQAGLSGPRRKSKGWLVFVLSVLLGAGIVGIALEQSRDVVVVEPAARTGRLVDVEDTEPTTASKPPAPTEAPKASLEAPPGAPATPPAAPPPPRVMGAPTKPETTRRRRRARRKAPAKAPTGHASISSVPTGLIVKRGSTVLGKTPLKASLPPGKHRLVLESASRGIRRELNVEIAAGGTTSHKVQVARGRLKVVARPWAEVYVNGVHKGKTPLTVPLFVGKQTLKLVTEDKRERIQTVTIEPDKEKIVAVKF